MTVDALFPLLLREWKDSWVQATNSPGELKCKVEQAWGEGYEDGDALIAAMDAAGVQTVLATDLLAWSYPRQERFAVDMTGRIAELSRKYPGRIYGLGDYDPGRIGPSLAKLEHDVKVNGFVGVYVHVYGWDIGLDHRKMYPLYAKCQELGIPVSMQTGHVLEAMPSEHGRPMQLDRIACDFPELTLIGTHTGFPWVDEMMAVAMKWPNVYINISAWLPKYISPALLRYMGSRGGSHKVMFGSNGLDWTRYLKQMHGLDMPEERLNRVLFENARRVHKI